MSVRDTIELEKVVTLLKFATFQFITLPEYFTFRHRNRDDDGRGRSQNGDLR